MPLVPVLIDIRYEITYLQDSETTEARSPYEFLLEKLVQKYKKSDESIRELKSYYPFKLNIRDLTVEVDNTSRSISAAPMSMLSNILKMNVEGRDCLQHVEEQTFNHNPCTSKEVPNKRTRARPKEKSILCLNPQDLFMVALQSCDAYLQQLLVEKMFQGKLAFPFLFPSPMKDNINILTS